MVRGATGQGPTCTKGSDILVHLEADNSAVVVNDVCLSIPGTGHYLLMPVALKKARNKDAGQWPGAIFGRDLIASWEGRSHMFPSEPLSWDRH